MKNRMEHYRNYMNSISVDMTLHNKIMNRITQKPKRRCFALYRYAAVFACAVIVLIGIWTVPHLLHPSDTASPPTIQSKDVPNIKNENVPDFKNKYSLFFNRAEGVLSQAKYIPGYFTKELSQEEIGILFGDVWQTMKKNYRVSASAGFSGEGRLEGISVECEAKTTGFITRIQIAKGPVGMDYIYPGDVKLSEVNGTVVTAGYWNDQSADGQTLYYASFVLDGIGYYMEIRGDERAKEELTTLVGLIIENGAADLSKITPDSIPGWREEELTFGEAQADPDFGAYVPNKVPAGFIFESARRILNQNGDELIIRWSSGMKYLECTVAHLKEEDKVRIVDVNAPETYDLTLYSIPFAESVPEPLQDVVNNPIFRVEDLTMETVYARAHKINDAGDDNTGYKICFSVLYGDIVVRLNAKGVHPEEIYDMLKELKNVK